MCLSLFDGCSETNQLDTNLLVELWDKGILWDTNLGGKLIPLSQVRRSNEVCILLCLSNIGILFA